MPTAAELQNFWHHTRDELATTPLEVQREPLPSIEAQYIDSWQLSLRSFDGVWVKAVYSVPRTTLHHPLPAILFVPGYGGGLVHNPLLTRSDGFAWLTLCPRGQYDGEEDFKVPAGRTKLTCGLQAPKEHYYRAAFMDCVRAIDFLCSCPEVDQSRIGVAGGSQGGGLTLATAALDERVACAFSHVPFLCHYEKALETATTGPYLELVHHFTEYPDDKERGLQTLAWIDPLNIGHMIRCPVQLTVGLKDTTCPPETIMPVFENIQSVKSLIVWPQMPHECNYEARRAMVAWLRHYLTS